ncbi:MAG: Holliday junction resolvase RuvX [Endozoicomonadaceae bacterium]|nr:Holliday junction resolvase RuvX [Endozoicomonadaceae bacterium]
MKKTIKKPLSKPSILPWKVVLSFDFGVKRIGVAVGQSVTQTANPLPIIPAKFGIPRIFDLEKLVFDWQPDAFIVGIPLHMDGSWSPMALRARKFACRLSDRFNKPWYAVDERLTTFEARGMQKLAWQTKQLMNKPLDSLVAQRLFDNWIAGLSKQCTPSKVRSSFVLKS